MILIVNHKANFNLNNIIKYEKNIRKYNIIILPSTCYLSIFKKGNYTLGSQDISEFNDEIKTGEVTGKQLHSLNIQYSLIGHSERRLYNKETDEIIIKKLNNCYENSIIPLYCIGGSKTNNKEKIKEQIDLFINNFPNKLLYLIYEPEYNIGNKNPDIIDIEENIEFIKKYLTDNKVENRIIYGGGVNIDSIDKLKLINNLDGFIISSSSLNINDLKIIYEKTK